MYNNKIKKYSGEIMMAANNNETAQETPAEEYGQKLKKVLKEAEAALKTGNVQEIFKTVIPSVYGVIQALNTTDDLLLKKSEAVSNRQTPSPSPARKELAVYKNLSENEWKQYFELINTTQLSQEQSKRLRNYLKENAEKEPYLRRLVRETIQHGKPITVSSTSDDWEKLKNDNATGVTDWKSRYISLLPEELVTPAMFHEILHIGQGDDGLGNEPTYYSREVIQKQRKLIEAEAMSVDYLCYYALNTGDSLSDELANGKNAYEPDYFRKLVEKNKKELHQKQKDIPVGLTDEEKELWIHTQAVNRAMGASIHILMQPEGEKTQEAAAAYGIELTDKDLECVNWWKQFYNNGHKKWICCNYSKEEDGTYRSLNLERTQFIQDYMTNRYPDLKGKDFLVTGLTDAEQKSWDIREEGLYYSEILTDEQIKALNLYYHSEEKNVQYIFSREADSNRIESKTLPLTEEEMKYLQQLDEIQAGKKNETDIPMPASLKNLIETQEKTLQYHSPDEEVAAFQELEASRKELFEKENQQPNLTATIKSIAQRYKENDEISSTTLQESEKSM